MNNIPPEVSVCIFTYNHEKYIEQCIESVLMQKTQFQIEIVIGEDYSTDKTRDICKDYQSRFKEIVLIDRGKNVGMRENVYRTIMSARGKYIAILDGDDYWIHPFKLQKQFDYMIARPEVNLCFHQTIRIYEVENPSISFFVKRAKDFFSLSDIIEEWTMATGSMFFKREAMIYPDFLFDAHNFDLAIQLILLRDNSKAGFIDEILSVYRSNQSSNSCNVLYNDYNSWIRLIKLFVDFNNYTKDKYESIIQKKTTSLKYSIKTFNRPTLINRFKSIIKKVLLKYGYKITITRKHKIS
jgi:glycosyltransferase involved in cell wall biosynthesis